MKKGIGVLFVLCLVIAVIVSSCQQTAVTSAKVYMQQKNPDKAIEQAMIAIKTIPTDAEAYFVLGEAYGMKSMYREMNEAFTNSLKNSDAHAAEINNYRERYYSMIFNEGVSNFKQNRMDKSIENFKMAIDLLPKRTEAYKNLSFAYGQSQQDSLALLTLMEGIKQDPNDVSLNFYLGLAYYKANQYNQCIEQLEKVLVKEQPASNLYIESLYHIAIAYDFLNQEEKALEKYQEALQIVPDNVNILFNLGRLYQNRKDYAHAIEYFDKVIKIDPSDFGALMSLGYAYLVQEKFSEAIPYYQKAVELKADNVNAWNSLGTALIRAGRVEEGKKAYDKAKELGGE